MSKVQGSGASSAVQRSVHSDEATKGEKDSNPIAYFKSFMNSSTLKKDKNERSRFLGDGVSYKAKLIGILEVSEARGDRMCQEALADLKMAIRAAGEHKQRININIAIDGLRLRDEKTGDCLYHHPVHKISFIAQDMSDSRAFGYIFGSPDTGHRFFGIKTDKAASQVVISMRDLFQVVFELKKKEIEMAKQHIEQHQVKFTSNLLAESSVVKVSTEPMKMLPIAEDKNKEGTCGAEGGEKQEQIMDLLGLELELNNIQQGINQMERITPSDPFGPPTLSKVQADPFGDSFNPLTSEAKLPPPPDSTKRSRVAEKHWFDQETEALFEETDLPTSLSSLHATAQPVFSPPGISMPLSTQCVVDENTVRYSESSPTHEQFDVFTELDPLGTGRSKPYIDKKDFFQELKNPPKKVLKDLVSEVPADIKTMFQTNFGNDTSILLSSKTPDQVVISKTECSTQAFTDPFQDDPFDRDDPFSEVDFPQNVCFNPTSNNDPFEKFADFASFNTKNEEDLTSDVKVQKITSVATDDATKNVPLRVSLPPEKHNNDNVFLSPQQSRKHKLQKHNTVTGIIKLPSPKQKVHSKFITQASVDDFVDHGSMEGVTLRNRSLTHSLSNGSTCSDLVAPEPPPRLSTNAMAPPLPPKRLAAASVKPPPRPPQSDYDYIENYQTTNVCNISSPPLPAPARKPKNDQKPSTETEYYLQPFPLLPPPKKKNPASPKSTIIPSETSVSPKSAFCANKSLDITLSQLTKTGFSDLAATLNMSPTSLSKMTLQDLTKCLAKLATENKEEGAGTKLNGENKIDKNSILNSEQYLTLQESLEDDTPAFPVEFDVHFDNKFQSQLEESLFDKYAVFRELLEQEKKQIDAPVEKNVKIIDESDKETDFKILKDEDSVPQTECSNTQPVEDRYAALRDICLDEVLYEDEEGDGSDKDDSIADPSRMEEDNDLLSQSHPHSESTESPTLTMKEHQSIMETTIMEEDVSALEVDEDDAPEESVDDTLQGTSPQNFIKYEEDNNNPVQASPNNEKPLFSPAEEIDALVKNKQGNQTPVGSVVPWAKFDNGTVLVLDKGSSVHSEGRVSPWSTESKDNDTSPACREQRKHRKTKRHKQNLRQEDEESEEGWGGRSPSCWSPSWRENGWSDGDSLYDETHPYMDRDYHSPRRGRRRRLSPWNSRDHSPWEEDDRDLIEGQWENARWQEEPRPRPKHRTLWDEERKHHYDDPRKPRKSMMWTNEMDRKSSRESLAWEDDDRYQKRNYTDRRRRKWDDESHSRNRGWREREWIEPGIKHSSRYYRERSHEPSWEDLYSEHGDDEAGHWSQRPRSCERGRRQYSSHHSNDGDYGERRFIHSMNREDYCAELDYRWKSHTLQRKKSRRKHSQNSPFEDDFMSHFSFSKDIKSPGDGSDVFDPDVKQGTPQSDSHKKCSFSEGSKKKEYISSSSHVGSYSRDGMMPLSKGFRSYQQSPFEDDFTSPTPRRSSGRSASSDISDPKGSDDIYLETKDSFTQIKIEPNKQPRRANQIDTFTGNKPSKYGAVAAVEAGSDSNGGKTTDQVEHENITIETPSIHSEKKPTDFKQVPTNLIRSDSNTSLRKSESVNIFARNRDPFDDDFFCEDVSPVQQRNEKKIRGHELNKWTDTFNAFSFDEESK